MRRRPVPGLLVAVAITAIAVFTALTVVVTSSRSLAVDASAFEIAGDLRAPWLNTVARAVTDLGLFAVVGSAVLVAVLLLLRRRERARAAAVAAGALLAWAAVWIVKWAVDRPRPPAPLVHTSGPSFPSGHAANSIAWLAIAIGLTVLIPTKGWRLAAIIGGALLLVLVGLSRIYLRAHYASDVVGGEALAVALYALAALGAAVARARNKSRPRRPGTWGSRPVA